MANFNHGSTGPSSAGGATCPPHAAALEQSSPRSGQGNSVSAALHGAEPSQSRTSSTRHLFLDVLLVVSVALLLLVAAAIAVHRYRRDQVRTALISELTAITAECRAHLSRPAPAAGSREPAFVSRFQGAKGTAAGGSYRWDKIPSPTPGVGPAIRVSLTSFPPDEPLNLSLSDLLHIDRILDDGAIDSGNFRTGFNGWPILIVPTSR